MKIRASFFLERDGRLIETDADTGEELSDMCAACGCEDCCCDEENDERLPQ